MNRYFNPYFHIVPIPNIGTDQNNNQFRAITKPNINGITFGEIYDAATFSLNFSCWHILELIGFDDRR